MRKRRRKDEESPDCRWSVDLHPFEHEAPSKTGTWDETVELGDRGEWLWVGEVLDAALARHRKAGFLGVRSGQLPRGQAPVSATLLGRRQEAWVKLFKVCGGELGLPKTSDIPLYRLRDGGASHDTAHRVRTLDEVAKRGAWKAAASVARYAKPGRVNDEFGSLPEEVRVEVLRRSDGFKDRLRRWPWSKHKRPIVRDCGVLVPKAPRGR